MSAAEVLELEPRIPPVPGPSLVGRVLLSGQTISRDQVAVDITITYGRTGMDEAANAGSVTMAFYDDERHTIRQLLEVGVSLEVWGGSYPVFRGEVSDIGLDFSTLDAGATIQVVGVGPLAKSGRILVDTSTFPVESVRSRIQRIEKAIDLPVRIEMNGDGPLVQKGQDGNYSAQVLLEQLCVDAGAILFDDPGGAYAGNLDLPATLVFQDIRYRGTYPVLELDPDRVILAPEWTKRLDLVNRVVVGYRPQVDENASVVRIDKASQAEYGRWDDVLETELVTAAAATARAADRLTRRAIPFWTMPSCEYQRTYLSKIPIGQRLGIAKLPAGAPRTYWSPVVEGYQHQVSADGVSTLFYLSDPRASYLSDKWMHTEERIWELVNPATRWGDIVTTGDLD